MRGSSATCALDVVNAIYQLDAGMDEWLGNLCVAAEKYFDHGLGVLASVGTLGPDGQPTLTHFGQNGRMPPAVFDLLVDLQRNAPEDELAAVSRAPSLFTTSENFELSLQRNITLDERFFVALQLGLQDCLTAKVIDLDGRGIGIYAPLPARDRVDDQRSIARWGRVMTHAMAALRLRTALGDQPEAILDPGGRILHAVGPARAASAQERLRAYAVSIDRARSGHGRRDPDGALAAWTALASGRWSLVDRFEADGRRFIIARRNDAGATGPERLSARERQVLAYTALGYSNKETAYALGLAPSTISTHLRNSMRRLGTRQLGHLIELYCSRPSSTPTVRTGEERPTDE